MDEIQNVKGSCILIVSTASENQRRLIDNLRKLGCQIETSRGLDEARNKLSLYEIFPFSLIIVDATTTLTWGYAKDFLRDLREHEDSHFKELPVLVIVTDEEKLESAGLNTAFITETFSPRAIQENVARLLS